MTTIDLHELNRTLELLLAQAIEDRKKAEEDRKKAEQFSADLKILTERQDREYAMVKESVWLWWKYAEEVAYRGMKELFGRKGIELHEIRRRVKWTKTRREYDLIGINDESVMVVEVKNDVKVDDILTMIESQLPSFKKEFPEYKNYKVYGCIVWLVFADNVQKMAYKEGLYVMKTNGEQIKIANDNKFQPKIFA